MKSMKRYRWLLPVLIFFLVALVVLVMTTRQGNRLPEDQLVASGTIEATEVRIGFRMPGTLAQRPVEEGDAVEKGALIAALDSREIEARLLGAEAGVQVAQALLAEQETGFRTEEAVSYTHLTLPTKRIV